MMHDQGTHTAAISAGADISNTELNHIQIDKSIKRLASITRKICDITERINGEDGPREVDTNAKDACNISLRELLCGSSARINDHHAAMFDALKELENSLF